MKANFEFLERCSSDETNYNSEVETGISWNKLEKEKFHETYETLSEE